MDIRAYVLSLISYSVLEPRRCAKHSQQTRDVDPMLDQRWPSIKPARWSGSAYFWRRVQADTDPMFVKCWASIAGAVQYPFSILVSTLCWQYWHDALNQSWVNVGSPSVALAHIQHGAKHKTVTQYWANVGSPS